MAQSNFAVRLKVAWWVKPYVRLITLMHRLTGREVDLNRMAEQCRRGIKVEIEA
ncbi:hypothetical protein FHR87_002377 [Azomonas macrocytogenes]|uniref:Uncharacterized protein n=1 Tax=Azomonas macrocytogenes TaxID=69962 RepID=A0A839T353_AZOMA|nr:hypothetical protein [Azomonas macrocytogenes]